MDIQSLESRFEGISVNDENHDQNTVHTTHTSLHKPKVMAKVEIEATSHAAASRGNKD